MIKDPNQLAEEILSLMTGRENAVFANLDEKDLPYVRYAFDGWLTGAIDDDKTVGSVIYSVWKRLEKSHRLRRVK